jgi:predicted RecA/RadA family phage recombinase
MKNYVQSDGLIEYTAPLGGVVSGRPVTIGNLLVIATVTAAAGARFVGLTEGVIEYAKAPSEAWDEGEIVYWDEDLKRFTTSAGDNIQAGTATIAVGSGAGETLGTVRLDAIGRVNETT